MARRKKEDNEWLWVIGAGVVIYLIGRKAESGASSFLDNLFGFGQSHTVPMPDWHQPEYSPTEIEILSPKLTPSTFEEMLGSYVRAFKTVTGEVPSMRMLGMTLAQSALETGQWKKMWEWNPANITTQGKRGFYRLPGDSAHKYAAYPSADSGAAAHVGLLGRKYPKSMGLMLTATPAEVAAMLKQEGFYEAAAGPYAEQMTKLFDQFMPRLPGPVTGDDDA
jgi:hypothetical protein